MSITRNQSTDGWYITLGHDDYQNFKIELWGGKEVNSEPVFSLQHENLNGKHIKDRVGKTRTVIFPDGAKLTLAAESEDGRMLEISIYDNGVIHHYNPTCRTLELSVKNAEYADHFDLKQADGEASAIEFTDTGLIWINVYREDTPGNKVDKRELLGEIDRAYPNRVNDFFDDPRMGHT